MSLLKKLFSISSKHKYEDTKFILTLEKVTVGTLACINKKWYFEYSDEFKAGAELCALRCGDG